MNLATIRRHLREGDFKRIQTESSVIAGVGFIAETADESEGTLLVFFNSRKVYAYSGRQIKQYRAMAKAKSVGKYFNQRIKAEDTGRKVTESWA